MHGLRLMTTYSHAGVEPSYLTPAWAPCRWADVGPGAEAAAAQTLQTGCGLWAMGSREYQGSGEASCRAPLLETGHFYGLHVRQSLCQLPKTPLQT